MSGEVHTQVRADDLRDGQDAEASALRAQCAMLRVACEQIRQASAATQRDATRIRAASRYLRGELVRARIPRDPACGAIARGLIEEHLGTASAKELADAKTVASELVNNAFLHGKGTIELRITNRRACARIAVIDEGEGAAVRAGHSDGCHGLDIVDALSVAWGVAKGSTHVWAELRATGLAADRPSAPQERIVDSA
jgi:hypothetical protein